MPAKRLKIIAIFLSAAIAALLAFLVPLQTYAENVYYNGEIIEGCTARKYLLRGVIATAPDGKKYKWSDSTKTWTLI